MWRLYLKKKSPEYLQQAHGWNQKHVLGFHSSVAYFVANWNWNKDLQTLSDDTQVEPRRVWISSIVAEAQLLLDPK